MTIINSLITNLKNEIDKDLIINIKIYLFGSAKSSNNYNDIDLLIVYKDNSVNIVDILLLRKKIADKLKSIYEVGIDICILSEKENEETKFIEKENGIKLLLTPHIIQRVDS